MPEKIKSKMNDFHDIYTDEDSEPFEASKTEEAANMIIEAAKMTGNEITYNEINAMIADSMTMRSSNWNLKKMIFSTMKKTKRRAASSSNLQEKSK